MANESHRILQEALSLPTVDRARLASELMASVDGAPDPDADEAWRDEVDRRVQRVQSQGPAGDDWQIVHARIAAQLRAIAK